MPGLIPRAFIDELLARTDIVDVIGGRITLKKAGREWKANCPLLHSPSLKLNSFTTALVVARTALL